MNKMKSIKGKPRAVIVAALAMLVAALLVMAWAGQRLFGLSGAADLAEDAQGQMWLALDGNLVQLSEPEAIQLKHERLTWLSPCGHKLARSLDRTNKPTDSYQETA